MSKYLMLGLFILGLSGSAFASCTEDASRVALGKIREMMEEDSVLENAKVSHMKMQVERVTTDKGTRVTVYFSFDQTGAFDLSFVGELELDPSNCTRMLSLPTFHQVDPVSL